MSQSDVKHLKQLEFPTCAKEALQKLEAALVSGKTHSKPNFHANLVSEFIFLDRPKDVDLRKNGGQISSPLSSLQEFQLIIVLVEYFSQPGPDADRYSVFLLLFGNNSTSQRGKILCKLISTAISTSIPSVLSFAGTWMSQFGCCIASCLDVAQNLVSDFITYSRKTSEQLQQLPLIAPHFTANLIISITELYLNEQRGVLIAPPDAVVEVFTDWINEHHNLCLPMQLPFTVPNATSQGSAVVQTLFPGLVRWVVLSPLVTMRLVYSKLHLALLQTMLDMGGSEPITPTLTAQQIMPTVSGLQTYAATLALKNVDGASDAQLQKGLERLAQILQIALHTNFVTGNMPQLLFALDALPAHPLMGLVTQNFRKTVEINT